VVASLENESIGDSSSREPKGSSQVQTGVDDIDELSQFATGLSHELCTRV
jgi:hypothetical protein